MYPGHVSDASWTSLMNLLADTSQYAIELGGHRVTFGLALKVVLVALTAYVIARLLLWVSRRLIRRAPGLDLSQRVLLQKLSGIAIIAVTLLIFVDVVGIDLTALTVFSGAVGLAIGFGLQKTFGNLISGLILLMDRSIKPGDVIEVGDSFGVVNRIGVRAVSVITRDGKEHLIPNEKLMTEEVINWSFSSRDVRIHIPVGVSYQSDITLAQKLMADAALGCQRVLKDPPPAVWIKEFGDSAVNHEILVWIRDPEEGVSNVQSEILGLVWAAFKANGIEIPYPQRDLHIRSSDVPSRHIDR